MLIHGVFGMRNGLNKERARPRRGEGEVRGRLKRHLDDGGMHSTLVIWGEGPARRLDIIRLRRDHKPLQVKQPRMG